MFGDGEVDETRGGIVCKGLGFAAMKSSISTLWLEQERNRRPLQSLIKAKAKLKTQQESCRLEEIACSATKS